MSTGSSCQSEETGLKAEQQLPGSKLVKAREQLGLSRAEVSADLNLSEAIIASLELDQYDRLPGKTFSIGYLRSYARYLKLHADELVEQLASHNAHKEKPTRSLINIRRQVKPQDPIFKWVSFAIVLVILALSTVWWRSQGDVVEERGVSLSSDSTGTEEWPDTR